MMIKRIFTAIKTTCVRIYALAVMLLVLWAGYQAVTYLFRSVFSPTPVPRVFLEPHGHDDAYSANPVRER